MEHFDTSLFPISIANRKNGTYSLDDGRAVKVLIVILLKIVSKFLKYPVQIPNLNSRGRMLPNHPVAITD